MYIEDIQLHKTIDIEIKFLAKYITTENTTKCFAETGCKIQNAPSYRGT